MQSGHHALRVPKAPSVEVPRAVAGLPRVVYHKHAGRHAVVKHGLCVGEDPFFVLVICELDPCVQLRRREILHRGQFAGRGEPLSRGVAERFRETGPRLFVKLDRSGVRHDRDRAVLYRGLYGSGAPDRPSPVGDEQRHRLMPVAAQPQVALEVGLCIERHLPPELAAKAPPVLARKHVNPAVFRANRQEHASHEKRQYPHFHSRYFTPDDPNVIAP